MSTATLLASVVLEYVTMAPLLAFRAPWHVYAQWGMGTVLAIAIAGAGIVCVERLLEVLFPRRERQTVGSFRRAAGLWGALMVGLEAALAALVLARVDLLAPADTSAASYATLVLITMTLPILGGAIHWDALRFVDVYKRTQARRLIDTRLAEIESMLRQNEAHEQSEFAVQSLKAWRRLLDFRSARVLLSPERHEELAHHFAASYERFEREARRRYLRDVRELRHRDPSAHPQRIRTGPTSRRSGGDGFAGCEDRGIEVRSRLPEPKSVPPRHQEVVA